MGFKNYLKKNQIAYELDFTWIDQIVYELITNQLKPIPVAAPLTHFCASNLSLIYYRRADFTNIIKQ